ncbi:hypothetical protein [Haloarchaeobius sp. DT45]|uniref:hypothetical protein n=1 Tax=Haloarchaeobius sp. DT45 TaxID=3446116 RepID=UPI003F6B9D01
MSIFPHPHVPTVEVFAADSVPSSAIDVVERVYEETFGVPVTRRGALPGSGDHAVEGPISPYSHLETLEEQTDADFAYVLTDRPIEGTAGERGNGMYYRNEDQDGRAILTTAEVTGGESVAAQDHERLRKLATQFAGGLFGFDWHDDCVMAEFDGLDELDEKPAEFCDDCAQRFRGEDTAPEPDEWHVTTQTLEEFETAMRWADGDIRLTEYPLIALGVAYNTVEDIGAKLPNIGGTTLPRSVRASIHKTYRSVRFVVNAVLFLVLAGASFVLLLDGYTAVSGGEPSTAVAFGGLVVALVIGFVAHAIVTGIFGGLVQGFAEGASEGLGAEE